MGRVMKRVCGVMAALALLLTAFSAVLAVSADTPVKIACVGDSITAGSLSSGNEYTYPSVLGRLLGSGYSVVNYGVSGTTLMSSGDSPYIRTDRYTGSQAFLPDIVILMLGTNDSKSVNWQYIEDYEGDLREMISVYQGLSSHPTVVVATSPTAFSTAFDIQNPHINEIAEIQRKVAREMGCPLIDIHVQTEDLGHLFDDGIHMNDDGYAVLADLMRAGLLRASIPAVDGCTAAGRSATIDNEAGTISLQVPQGTDLTSLDVTLSLPSGATAEPADVTDFSSPVTYTVTSPDGTQSKAFTVTVTQGDGEGSVDKAALKEALDDFEALQATDYTSETAFIAAMAAQTASTLLDDTAATQSEVDWAATRLQAAVSGVEDAQLDPPPADALFSTGFEAGQSFAYDDGDITCEVDGVQMTIGWDSELALTGRAESGSGAVKLGGYGRVCLELDLEPGTTYVISGSYRNTNPSAELQLALKPTGAAQDDDAAVLDSDSLKTTASMGIYRPFSFEITTPDDYDGGYVMLKWTANTVKGVWIDNLSVVPQGKASAGNGDVNGDGKINSSDARLVLQHTVELITLDEKQLVAADVDGNGQINSSDARWILQTSVSLIPS